MLIHQPKTNIMAPYVFFDKEFTASECRAIMHIAKGLKPHDAMIGGGGPEGANVKEIRSAEVSWLKPAPDNQWIFDRLSGVCSKVRQGWYPFTLSGFEEPIQMTHYLASEGGHYDTHMDMGGGEMSTRKLSLVMLLNDPAEFKGGELEVLAIPGTDKTVKEVTQGTVIAFPSWALHRVLKLTEGERWSLVCWVHGPQFV